MSKKRAFIESEVGERMNKKRKMEEIVQSQVVKVRECQSRVDQLSKELNEAKDAMVKEGGILADLYTMLKNEEEFYIKEPPSSQVTRLPSFKTAPSFTPPNRSPMSRPATTIIRTVTGAGSLRKSGTSIEIVSNSPIKPAPVVRGGTPLRKSASIELASKYQPAHAAKPRSISFNPKDPNSFATSALDGTLNFWKLEGDRFNDLGCLTSTALRTSRFPTDIDWHEAGKCAILFPLTMSKTEAQIAIFNTDNLPKLSAMFSTKKPHSKDPTCIKFLTEEKLLTAGVDKNVVLWKINFSTKSADTEVLYQRHTSAINTLCMNDRGVLYSGGSDRKLIAFNLTNYRPMSEIKLENKISSIRLKPMDHNLLLLSLTTRENQLQVLDMRTEKAAFTLSYNFPSGSPSQYIIPSWSQDGNYICTGSVEPVVHLYDVRNPFSPQLKEPTVSCSVHNKRVQRAEFHPTDSNRIITLSSDKTIGLHDIKFLENR